MSGHNQLRIIGGSHRRRNISFPTSDGLRPTGDRIRETLFNWLEPEIAGTNCLDLFAGSGALGFESLSRGARAATLLETNRSVVMNLRDNTTKLGFTNVRIIQAEARQWLISEAASDPFDVVLLIPLLPTTCFMNAAPACQRAGCWLKRQKCIWNTIRQSITQNCPPAGHSLKPKLRAGFASGSILFPKHSSPYRQCR